MHAERHKGCIHRWSRTLIPTSKDAPADAEAPSHRLLVRAGFIRRVGAGIYDYLPLGWRVIRKVSEIVREEMDAAGASEMLMPALEPIELMQQTGRDEAYGDNLFRITDRHDRIAALAPTHEEIITELMKGGVTSYRQLPLNLYQIQTKFRDEFRPRSGLLRCREFLMKDAYSFHTTVEGAGGLNDEYDAMHAAYTSVFNRCGLDFTVVEAEAGPIGGSASHEFMVNCETGEDTILVCPETGYAANVEKCETGPREHDFAGAPSGDLEVVDTPDCPAIEDVSKLLKVKPRNMLKCIVFESAQSDAPARWVIAVVRGDHDANEGKVRAAAGFDIRLADDQAARKAGFVIGYVSPRAALAVKGTLLLVDPDAGWGMDASKGKPMFWVTGADEKDRHVKHFNWAREIGSSLGDQSYVKVADVRNAEAGDPSPKSPSARLEARRGIEVGHIFKLGTKYSEAMGFTVLTEDQSRRAVIMGCYGIGVSRTAAACVEQNHDENGIVWPWALSPYHALIVMLPSKERAEDIESAAQILAAKLSEAGLDVLIDDRDERPGVKFKDADLIGIPARFTVSEKAIDGGGVEFKLRSDPGKGEVLALEDAVSRCLAAATSDG